MTDLEVFKLSAQMCGKEESKFQVPGEWRILDGIFNVEVVWNPFTNPAQRDECMDKLLNIGYWIYIQTNPNQHHVDSFSTAEQLNFDCPWREFPARALAEIGRKG